MTLYEELYFEIKLSGEKSQLERFVGFLSGGGIDDFFEFSSDYINYDDGYDAAEANTKTEIVISNDDFGIEIDRFDTEEFLDVFCRAARALDVRGQLYDLDDEEYNFKSEPGDSYYVNADKIDIFNEDEEFGELDE